MQCDQVFELLSDLLDGSAEPELEAAALEHLATCTRCETTFSETRSLIALAPEARPAMLDPARRAALRARLAAAVGEDS